MRAVGVRLRVDHDQRSRAKGGRRAYEERAIFWRWWRDVAHGGPPHSACFTRALDLTLEQGPAAASPIATAASATASVTGAADTPWWRLWPWHAQA